MHVVDISTISNCRKIVGYEGYWISDDGRVFSEYAKGRVLGLSSARRRIPDGKVSEMKCSISTKGYRTVRLRRDNKGRHIYVHRLVLEAFVGPWQRGMETRHLDGNKLNNHIDNLAWGTQVENNDDKLKHGNIPFGDNHKQAKLTSENVVEIVRLSKAGMFRKEVAAIFNVTSSNISMILTGRSWRHVTEKILP